MQSRTALLGMAALLLVSGCSRSETISGSAESNTAADVYGYSDTVATIAGPPPTQPPDPAGLGTSGSSSVDGAEPQGVKVAVTTVANPACVVVAEEGDTVDTIVTRLVGVDAAELRNENGLGDNEPDPGQPLDICIANDIFDIYGTSRIPPSGEYAEELQTALNGLLDSTSMLELAVDGDAGKLTQQATCAARALIGLPVSTGYPIAGSAESEEILNATSISVPAGAPTDADRWILIDKTCQVMFVGERDVLVDVYPTSTGAPGYETEDGDFEGHRFDPALDRNGWHDSTAYPAGEDDPNNGNMYKPLYFNNNEAIHGAGYIPPEPRSKGCARTFPEHQDKIVEWLGLKEIDEEIWKESLIDVRVVVRGRYLTPAGEALPEPEEILLPEYERSETTVADEAASESDEDEA